MSRASRTARGAFGALAATLLAAASHSLAGGSVTLFALVATSLLALPLCVALAGRAGSLWRLSLGVFASQALYHWSFAGLGVASNGSLQRPASADAAAGLAHDHLGAFGGFAPDAALTAGLASSDAGMWAAHAVAALLTIALLHRGEAAALRLVRVLRRLVPSHAPRPILLPARPATPAATSAEPARRLAQRYLSAISHRGPSAPAFS